MPEKYVENGPTSRTAVNRLRAKGTKSSSPAGVNGGGQWINLEEKCTCHSGKGGRNQSDDDALTEAVLGTTEVVRADDAV